ncbi:hypothetical protein HanRHA438_Chr01g0045231 [Helianthus annuus]|nr:hypothetical protein HanRHA438_Chr01g0045231 [Helianthus annuus]
MQLLSHSYGLTVPQEHCFSFYWTRLEVLLYNLPGVPQEVLGECHESWTRPLKHNVHLKIRKQYKVPSCMLYFS